MTDNMREWATRLREYAVDCRAAGPLPDRKSLTETQEWQCCIVGNTILTWLQRLGPNFLEERAFMCNILEIDSDPLIVFTSNVPGLVAAREILGPDYERVVYLLDDEFSASPALAADPEYKWHIHFWSLFRSEIEPKFASEARAKYPIPTGHDYWLHSEGTMWAVLAGRGVDHLWQWDGHKPDLLKEAMTYWIS